MAVDLGFEYGVARFIDFRDETECERVRRIGRAELTQHANPDFRIAVVDDPADFYRAFAADLHKRGQARLRLVFSRHRPLRAAAHSSGRMAGPQAEGGGAALTSERHNPGTWLGGMFLQDRIGLGIDLLHRHIVPP